MGIGENRKKKKIEFIHRIIVHVDICENLSKNITILYCENLGKIRKKINFVSQVMVHIKHLWKYVQKYNGIYQLYWLGKKIKIYLVKIAEFTKTKIINKTIGTSFIVYPK